MTTKEIDRIHWTARCAYPGLDGFIFYSPTFTAESWSDLDDMAQSTVAEAWARISPHPAPKVVELIPGYLQLVKNSEREKGRS